MSSSLARIVSNRLLRLLAVRLHTAPNAILEQRLTAPTKEFKNKGTVTIIFWLVSSGIALRLVAKQTEAEARNSCLQTEPGSDSSCFSSDSVTE